MATFSQQIIAILRAPRLAQCGRWLVLALLLGLSTAYVSCADDSEELKAAQLEYQVKAGFLFNFAKFVEWPTNTINTPTNFRIAVADNGKAFHALSNVLAGKMVQGRTVEVTRLNPGDDPKQCEILFITRLCGTEVDKLLKAVVAAPVLTVGETEHFAERGGCINFTLKGQNIRFEVNLEQAGQKGLKISSKVASMATIVRNQKENP